MNWGRIFCVVQPKFSLSSQIKANQYQSFPFPSLCTSRSAKGIVSLTSLSPSTLDEQFYYPAFVKKFSTSPTPKIPQKICIPSPHQSPFIPSSFHPIQTQLSLAPKSQGVAVFLIIINKSREMHLQKENYLQIKYEYKKGLLLSWNFKDLHQVHNYYHHLLIIANPSSKTNQNLIQQYYKRMKFGDLIGVVYYHHVYGPRCYNWIEKTQLAQFQPSQLIDRITKEDLQPDQLDALIRFAADFSLENGGSNLICNFILSEDHRDRADSILQRVMAYRQEGAFPYHCTFFNLFWYNKISFNSGIHFLNTETKQIFQVLSLYHSIINNATVRSAKVIISCRNGQMMSYDANIWKNTEFNRIQRTFYGPSINYEEDIIQFHVLDAFEDAEFDLAFALELELFSGQLVSGNKRLKLSFPNERHYDKSLNLTVPEPLITFQGVELKNNPFSTTTFVRLMKSAYQDLNEIKEKLQAACKTRRIRERNNPIPQSQPEKEKEREATHSSTKRRPVQYFYPNQPGEQENTAQYYF